MYLRPELIELGYGLFLDIDILPAPLMAPVTRGDETVTLLSSGLDVVHLGHFLQVFGWQDQVRAAGDVVKFLSLAKGLPSPGIILAVRFLVSSQPLWADKEEEENTFRNDGSSFKELWELVTGEWEV
ncbi:hypothetical protein C7212DRAFT_341618 [Tuber magnatum]|uniref:Uncharacterized protein n=1 Tax=Tuber magnatum TaxID=42249 RepID=A0A317T0Q2_9PEZI|nr:hypothetical protein C7212DRAFT_341618 [Tuber magnatum]